MFSSATDPSKIKRVSVTSKRKDLEFKRGKGERILFLNSVY
ncbi:hypothetical protein ISN45_At03g036990 [Arabidopsis thaliana x Arabidopsis arenosa]|uniref:Uncharacterized protein n=1 Tax=Arabidopsis thaliana x Arabidopsis arenosa TaxID=1240361 RepID=A0A8T2F0H9_9BRAS|nr:hypothetical protein ISN45_At03g036990 [Arabidopsis thaliana x Arabidopsis arenosa]